MISIDWTPDRKVLHKFGSSMLIFGCVFAGWFWFNGSINAAWAGFGLGLTCFISSLVSPAAARILYRLWMLLAWALSLVLTPVIMSALYYLVITPIGFILRVKGHDRLRLKKPSTTSFWTAVDASRFSNYSRQF